MTLSPNERRLLIALRRGRHLKNNPGDVKELLGCDGQTANPIARRLIALGLARQVENSSKPGAIFLRIMDAGISQADILIDAERKPTIWERVRSLPVGKGLWEVFKLGLAALFGAAVKTYIG